MDNLTQAVNEGRWDHANNLSNDLEAVIESASGVFLDNILSVCFLLR